MMINKMKINHLVNPIGFDMEIPVLSWVVEESTGKRQEKSRIQVAEDEEFSKVVYDSGERMDLNSNAFRLPVKLRFEQRYFWKVTVWADNGDHASSDVAYFETAKKDIWEADWITPKAEKDVQVTLFTEFEVTKPVEHARMYMTGFGVYELYVNGNKQGDECLLPGFHDYRSWYQYQTFAPELKQGTNRIEIMLGDGWYKGNFGLRVQYENYGDRLACIGELIISYTDGTSEKIVTNTKWQAKRHFVINSGIYCGETQNMLIDASERYETEIIALDKKKLKPRLSPKIRVQEKLQPIDILYTPKGEVVLDMGQNMVGWLSFRSAQPKGAKIVFQFGEILQEGNFYRDNLRTAKSEFVYYSDGKEREVREYFTFHGFRYVKISGWEGEINKADFCGLVIYSDMEETGWIETSNDLVNQLFRNAKWGQKGNFLDVPTDCPQRDERMGWTGDAQIFSGTALFNMDAYAFYRKYGRDLSGEQERKNGGVPNVVPSGHYIGENATAWGDAATVIPWNVYLHSGDSEILERQYDSMKAWVTYMRTQDLNDGNTHLWKTGFHYGDWLALDGKVKGGVYGATENALISSAYYYYSTSILVKAAKVLDKKKDEEKYEKLLKKIQKAFIREYFTGSGRLAVNTTTAHVLVLYMGLVPAHAVERIQQGLKDKLIKNNYHLDTGFVGTPFLCRVLSDNGMNDIAYHLLLEKGYPGWLYEVLMGATTIWERWDSVLPDGKISGTEMNSLNHYSYGAIVEWMYRNMLGIQPVEEKPGFKKIRIYPRPSYALQYARGKVHTAAGTVCSEWRLDEDGRKLTIKVSIPFDTTAELLLPYAPESEIEKLEQSIKTTAKWKQEGILIELTAGCYEFSYLSQKRFAKSYSIDSSMEDLMSDEEARSIVTEQFLSKFIKIPFQKELSTLKELMNIPFTSIPLENQKDIDRRLRAINR